MSKTRAPWRALILTTFPEMFPGPLGLSLAGKGLRERLWELILVNIREYSVNNYNSIDDNSFGGGPGMVMRPDVVGPAIESTQKNFINLPLVFLTPRGYPANQSRIKELAAGPGVRLICGRFEGVDQRVLDSNQVEELSFGDVVMSGGEVAAMGILDACIRLLPGVVGKSNSLVEESFEKGLLEYPQYTRPQNWNNIQVPNVLLSGNHKKISTWRKNQAEAITRKRRPDLWDKYIQTQSNNETDLIK